MSPLFMEVQSASVIEGVEAEGAEKELESANKKNASSITAII
jgi:hypothetical protein